MRIKIWGARGSTPTAEPECMKYGGDTSCVEVRLSDGRIIILDAGSGLRRLGVELDRKATGPVHADLFITHGHWDHIQGFPFFSPAYVPGNSFNLYGLFKADGRVEECLSGMMGKLYFPVKLSDMSSQLKFMDILEGTQELNGVYVTTCSVNHPQGAVAYRIDDGHSAMVYCPDTEHLPTDLQPKLVELCRQADLLLHDAQYTPEEYESHKGWGHSTYETAAAVAKEAGVKELVLFHHAPEHDDDFMDGLLDKARGRFEHTRAATRDLEIESRGRGTTTYVAEPDSLKTLGSSFKIDPSYAIERKGDTLHVQCPPSRTVMTSDNFEQELICNLVPGVKKVDMNFQLVSRLNSASIKTLGKIVRECQDRKIDLVFSKVHENILEILRVTRFTEVVTVLAAE